MRIFKRLRNLEEQLINLATHVVNAFKDIKRITEQLKELRDKCEKLEARCKKLEEKLPNYEKAISDGVDKLWNDALQAVADYNPYEGLDLSAIGGDSNGYPRKS